MKLYTILDSQGPTTYHGGRAAAAVDVIHRLNGTGPQHLTGSGIVDALTRSSSLWILTPSGREVSIRCDEVGR
jgi:hypothetical protein